MFTIGYEGHSLESYLTALIRNGITILCDVRRNPLSRKYGFSKSTLARCCQEIGIRYEHIPELGIASDQRQELNTQADYDALFAEYMRDWLPGQATSLSKIRDWFDAGERIALTCYEHSRPNATVIASPMSLNRGSARRFVPDISEVRPWRKNAYW